jgi:CelD/BcsL family acetyltransferase involved in cellulose biosynthesis
MTQDALLDPVQDPRWGDFAARAAGASIFHHPAWLELLSSRYGYETTACCLVEDGAIVAGMPWASVSSRLTGARLVALPFSDVCPPLFAPGREPALAEPLGRAIEAERRRAGRGLEVRADVGGLSDAVSAHRFWQHRLALDSDPAGLEGRFKSQVRRGIAKARKAGLVVEHRTDGAAVDDFYRLHLRTRRRQGMPTQPKRFFRAVAGLLQDGLGFVLVTRSERTPIAAAVFLHFAGTLTYKWGASDERHLALRPNNLLFSEAVRWGCEQGCDTLDFGRTDLDNEGLRSFKRSWGTEEVALRYTYVGLPVPSGEPSRIERAMKATLRRSPPAAGRLIGAGLYRHFG